MISLREKPIGTVCQWDQLEDGSWETDCGEAFEIVEGLPSENKMKYCCFCGLNIIELACPTGNLNEVPGL